MLMSGLSGKISQIIGPVVDVHFRVDKEDACSLPAIHEALSIRRDDGREIQTMVSAVIINSLLFIIGR